MTLDNFVAANLWNKVQVAVDGEPIDFVVFDWAKVKSRQNDGSVNVYEYFIGWNTVAYQEVLRGNWIPFGAGNMFAPALKYDGGFQEMTHRGMLFADLSTSSTSPAVIYFHLGSQQPPKVIAGSIDDLGGAAPAPAPAPAPIETSAVDEGWSLSSPAIIPPPPPKAIAVPTRLPVMKAKPAAKKAKPAAKKAKPAAKKAKPAAKKAKAKPAAKKAKAKPAAKKAKAKPAKKPAKAKAKNKGKKR
jgi:hypothetical protein